MIFSTTSINSLSFFISVLLASCSARAVSNKYNHTRDTRGSTLQQSTVKMDDQNQASPSFRQLLSGRSLTKKSDSHASLETLLQECAAICKGNDGDTHDDDNDGDVGHYRALTSSFVKPSCCKSGLSALKMTYFGPTGTLVLANDISLDALHTVDPCDGTVLPVSHENESFVRFADCNRCFPPNIVTCDVPLDTTMTMSLVDGTDVCLVVVNNEKNKLQLEEMLPGDTHIFFLDPSTDDAVMATTIHTSCSMPIFPPFGVRLGICPHDDDYMIDFSTTAVDVRIPVFEFVDGVSHLQSNTLLSKCPSPLLRTSPDWKDDKCCTGGVSYFKARLVGISGFLTINEAKVGSSHPCERSPNSAITESDVSDDRDKKGRGKKDTSSSGSDDSEKDNYSQMKGSGKKGGSNGGKKGTSSGGKKGSNNSGKKGDSSSGKKGSSISGKHGKKRVRRLSQGSKKHIIPPVRFVDCSDECLRHPFEKKCSKLYDGVDVGAGEHFCIVSFASDQAMLSLAMPTTFIMLLDPESGGANVQSLMFHSKCSDSFLGFGQTFGDDCNVEDSTLIELTKVTPDDDVSYIKFVDGISSGHFEASQNVGSSAFDISFAECACSCEETPPSRRPSPVEPPQTPIDFPSSNPTGPSPKFSPPLPTILPTSLSTPIRPAASSKMPFFTRSPLEPSTPAPVDQSRNPTTLMPVVEPSRPVGPSSPAPAAISPSLEPTGPRPKGPPRIPPTFSPPTASPSVGSTGPSVSPVATFSPDESSAPSVVDLSRNPTALMPAIEPSLPVGPSSLAPAAISPSLEPTGPRPKGPPRIPPTFSPTSASPSVGSTGPSVSRVATFSPDESSAPSVVDLSRNPTALMPAVEPSLLVGPSSPAPAAISPSLEPTGPRPKGPPRIPPTFSPPTASPSVGSTGPSVSPVATFSPDESSAPSVVDLSRNPTALMPAVEPSLLVGPSSLAPAAISPSLEPTGPRPKGPPRIPPTFSPPPASPSVGSTGPSVSPVATFSPDESSAPSVVDLSRNPTALMPAVEPSLLVGPSSLAPAAISPSLEPTGPRPKGPPRIPTFSPTSASPSVGSTGPSVSPVATFSPDESSAPSVVDLSRNPTALMPAVEPSLLVGPSSLAPAAISPSLEPTGPRPKGPPRIPPTFSPTSASPSVGSTGPSVSPVATFSPDESSAPSVVDLSRNPTALMPAVEPSLLVGPSSLAPAAISPSLEPTGPRPKGPPRIPPTFSPPPASPSVGSTGPSVSPVATFSPDESSAPSVVDLSRNPTALMPAVEPSLLVGPSSLAPAAISPSLEPTGPRPKGPPRIPPTFSPPPASPSVGSTGPSVSPVATFSPDESSAPSVVDLSRNPTTLSPSIEGSPSIAPSSAAPMTTYPSIESTVPRPKGPPRFPPLSPSFSEPSIGSRRPSNTPTGTLLDTPRSEPSISPTNEPSACTESLTASPMSSFPSCKPTVTGPEESPNLPTLPSSAVPSRGSLVPTSQSDSTISPSGTVTPNAIFPSFEPSTLTPSIDSSSPIASSNAPTNREIPSFEFTGPSLSNRPSVLISSPTTLPSSSLFVVPSSMPSTNLPPGEMLAPNFLVQPPIPKSSSPSDGHFGSIESGSPSDRVLSSSEPTGRLPTASSRVPTHLRPPNRPTVGPTLVSSPPAESSPPIPPDLAYTTSSPTSSSLIPSYPSNVPSINTLPSSEPRRPRPKGPPRVPSFIFPTTAPLGLTNPINTPVLALESFSPSQVGLTRPPTSFKPSLESLIPLGPSNTPSIGYTPSFEPPRPRPKGPPRIPTISSPTNVPFAGSLGPSTLPVGTDFPVESFTPSTPDLLPTLPPLLPSTQGFEPVATSAPTTLMPPRTPTIFSPVNIPFAGSLSPSTLPVGSDSPLESSAPTILDLLPNLSPSMQGIEPVAPSTPTTLIPFSSTEPTVLQSIGPTEDPTGTSAVEDCFCESWALQNCWAKDERGLPLVGLACIVQPMVVDRKLTPSLTNSWHLERIRYHEFQVLLYRELLLRFTK